MPCTSSCAKARAPSGSSKFSATRSKASSAVGRIAPSGWLREVHGVEHLQRDLSRATARHAATPTHTERPVPAADLRQQRRHLDGGTGRLDALVALGAARARQRLIDVVGREHAEGDRNAGVAHHLAHAVGDADADVLEVRRAAANHDAQGDDGVVAAADGQGAGRLRELEGAGHPGDVDRVGIGPPRDELLGAAGEQTHADEVVEARHHHAEAQPRRVHRRLEASSSRDPRRRPANGGRTSPRRWRSSPTRRTRTFSSASASAERSHGQRARGRAAHRHRAASAPRTSALRPPDPPAATPPPAARRPRREPRSTRRAPAATARVSRSR